MGYHGYSDDRYYTVSVPSDLRDLIHEQASRAGVPIKEALSFIIRDWCERFSLEPPEHPRLSAKPR